MSIDLITPECLHKDELQYQLQARGLSNEGSNVATLRSLLRSSRDIKENSDVLATNVIFKGPVSALSFCRQRLNLIKDLVENTDVADCSGFPSLCPSIATLSHSSSAFVTVCQTWV
jgi:hypothetical protein